MIKVARKALCLDWDKRSLRIVVARVGTGEMVLEDAHSHRISSSVNADEPEAMGAFIVEQLQRHGIKQSRVIVDVPRDKAVINRMAVPPTPINELAAAVRFQAMRELPFSVDDAAIDFVVTKRDDNNMGVEVLLAAVRKETLDRLRDTCTAAGLVPARIGLRPYANVVSLTHIPAMVDRNVLFVDVGPTTTEIDVISQKTLAFSRAANVNVPMVGGEVDTEDSAVRVLRDESETTLTDAVCATAVGELMVEISRTLQAYRATETAVELEQIVIAGGTGIEMALSGAADDRFDLPVTLFDPTGALGVDDSESMKLRAFSSTLGLAWGIEGEGLLELDFLNPKRTISRQEVMQKRMRIAGIAATVLVVSALGLIVWDRIRLSHELSGLETQTDKLVADAKEDSRLLFKTAEVDEWDAEAETAVWLDHLLWLTRSAVEPGKKMLVTDLTFNFKNAGITMKLMCTDWKVANEFVKRLNELTNEKGQPIYQAEQGAWQSVKTPYPQFKGKVGRGDYAARTGTAQTDQGT